MIHNGYYVDAHCKPSPETVFIALSEDQCYSPIGQHSNMDYGYWKECKQITREQYLKHSGGFYTPPEYLEHME